MGINPIFTYNDIPMLIPKSIEYILFLNFSVSNSNRMFKQIIAVRANIGKNVLLEA